MQEKYLADDPLFIAICEQERNRFLENKRANIEGIFNAYVVDWQSADIRDRVRWLKGRGLTRKQIKKELGISLNTIKRFLKKMR